MPVQSKVCILGIMIAITHGSSLIGQDENKESTPAAMSPKQIFSQLTGRWKGTCKTWFEPGKLADEAEITGEFTAILGGKFLRHTYRSTVQGKGHQGEELLAYNPISNQVQRSWVDDFHMSYAIMFSEGKAAGRGFSVLGEYDVGPGQPRWGWRSQYEFLQDDSLKITAFNVPPDGQEHKAVEIIYHRVQPGKN